MLFTSEQQAENKLIILYVLDQMKSALTREQVALIVIENIQITYFDIQFYIDDLIKDDFVHTIQLEEKLILKLSDVGKASLEIFYEKIPVYIRDMIDRYLKENHEKIFKEIRVAANYHKKSDTEYIVELKFYENNLMLMEISLDAPTQKLALEICNRWKEKTQALYSAILKTLTS
ncbi:MAG: hypothetical protein PWP16_49 [Eubacteriaceae bacterium]|jgi:hypothetical protein|nr:hypothetical protein [Eubacteriaceae bacterium]MDK2904292.1 hypothetical protein [Eubacteriaceae bacterium]MDN5306686.1 hypothetical protein [Eubacteriaceae bacterium]